jgi:hypothetical protein
MEALANADASMPWTGAACAVLKSINMTAMTRNATIIARRPIEIAISPSIEPKNAVHHSVLVTHDRSVTPVCIRSGASIWMK